MLANPLDTTENCRYSLMCRHVCPVHHVTKVESLSPHGWALTVASVRRGLLAWNAESVDALYKCADCGLCQSNCATDQPLPTAIAAARAWVVGLDLAPPTVRALEQALETWGNPYEAQPPTQAEGQGEVALFVGDAARFLRPSTLEAALSLLRAVGVEPTLIGVGRNSGYLPSSVGLPATAERLARATLDELQGSGARRLLALTPGDAYTLGKLYDERLGLALPEGVELQEVTTFLAEQLAAGALRLGRADLPAPVAYLDPTHAARLPTRHAAPRRLLAAALAAPPIELFWREGRAHPGGDTALAFTQPALAAQLTEARLVDAAQVGAQTIVTEDPATLAHLSRHAARFGIEVRGLYEVLTERLET